MITKLIKVDPKNPDLDLLTPAAEALRRGELVCFPTETVYGLGAVWDDEAAVARIYSVKGRPQDNPLIVHESSVERMKDYFLRWDVVAEVLTRAFCPGPFTLIMEHRADLHSSVTAGLPTIGVRVPENLTALRLLQLTAKGVAAPSANLSGRPSPTRGEDAWEDLEGKIPYLIDAGPCFVGVESTIVSWVDGKLDLLRPGGISAERIREVLAENDLPIELLVYSPGGSVVGFGGSGTGGVGGVGGVGEEKAASPSPSGSGSGSVSSSSSVSVSPSGSETFSSADSINSAVSALLTRTDTDQAPRAPGMKYRHYAPRAKVHILGGADEVAKLRFLTDAIREGTIGAYPAFYLSQEICEGAERILSSEAIRYEIITFVSEESHHNAASGLFAAFRSFDRLNVTDIWAEEQPLSSLGTAYMNRLTKAAGAI